MNPTSKSTTGLAFLLAASMCGIAADAPSNAKPTVDQVLDRYVEAAGGKTALEKLKTRVTKGKMEMTTLGVGGAMEVLAKAPDKQVSKVELASFGSIREGFDGTVAWSAAPGLGVRNKSGSELERVRRSMAFPRELKLRQTYQSFQLTGSGKVGALEAWVVEAQTKGSKPDRLYFDKQSGLLLREEATVDTPVGEMLFQVDMSDYRDVDGVKVPFLVKVPKPETMGFQIAVSEVKHNVELADSAFAKPKN